MVGRAGRHDVHQSQLLIAQLFFDAGAEQAVAAAQFEDTGKVPAGRDFGKRGHERVSHGRLHLRGLAVGAQTATEVRLYPNFVHLIQDARAPPRTELPQRDSAARRAIRGCGQV